MRTREPATARGLRAAWRLALATTIAACGGAPPEGASPVPPAATTASPPEAGAGSSAAPQSTASASAAASSAPLLQLVTWQRRIEGPIASFALGKKRVAALGRADARYGPAWILDGAKLVEAPLPERLLAGANQRDDLRVHFGRDDWPRILGARFEGDRASGVYLRHKGGWRKEPGEIMKLVQPPDAAFFGVIGHDDPEVVCEVGDTCIIKRLSGWTFVPAGSERLVVDLSSGVGWGLGASSVSRMTERGWERVGGDVPWKAPGGVWGSADGTALWVSEPATDSMHRWEAGHWTRHASAVSGPRGVWGLAPDDVWLVGAGGVAHYDGKAWRRVAAPDGPFDEVRGRAADASGAKGDVWIAGAKGLWQATR